MVLWGASAAIGMLQAWIYSEPATMFGHRSGGIALYAHEGWRKYTTLVGPLSAFGYWIGWSVVLSIFGKIIGDLATSQWWPQLRPVDRLRRQHADAVVVHRDRLHHLRLGVQHLRPAAGGVVHLRLRGAADGAAGAVHHLPVLQRPLDTANVHATFPGPWGGIKLAIVYMFILAWSTYGTEACATFAPEYKSIQDTHRALRSAAMFMLLVCVLLPLGWAASTASARRSPPAPRASSTRSAMTTLVGHGAARSSRSASSPRCCCR